MTTENTQPTEQNQHQLRVEHYLRNIQSLMTILCEYVMGEDGLRDQQERLRDEEGLEH